jgi:hypothetical protein
MVNLDDVKESEKHKYKSDGFQLIRASDLKDPRVTRADEFLNSFDVSGILSVLSSNGKADGRELAAFTIKHTARRILPYGMWTCKDGSEVIFNRNYQPIIHRVNGEDSYIDSNKWIHDIVETKMFYNDANAPMMYLTKHLGQQSLSAASSKKCKKSLLICLQILRDYTPKESGSVSMADSIAKNR